MNLQRYPVLRSPWVQGSLLALLLLFVTAAPEVSSRPARRIPARTTTTIEIEAATPAEVAPVARTPKPRDSTPAATLTPEAFATLYPVRPNPIPAPTTEAERQRREAQKLASRKPEKKPLPRSSEVLLFLADESADPDAVAKDHALTPKYRLSGDLPAWVFTAGSPDLAEQARIDAAADPRVAQSFVNRRVERSKLWVPNDPLRPNNQPTASFRGQWHLGNGASSTHANLAPAWARELTGAGVLLALVDDGLEVTHPDLAGNFIAAHSLNFGASPPDAAYTPKPSYDGTPDEDRHGTSVAGVAAAVGGNGIGITGAAPLAGLSIERLDFPTLTDAMLVNAVLYHSSGTNTSIKIKNHSYGPSDTFIDNQPESNAVNTSVSAGTMHAYAAGNERGTWLEDSNKCQPQNSPDTIVVAAIGSDGIFSDYTSYGACVFVTAPSSSASGFAITTTDRVGAAGFCPNITLPIPASPMPDDLDPFPDPDYTSVFGGTSAATPLVAGILALAKQANPALNVRMAQHALARTSVQVNPTDGTIEGGGNGGSGTAWKTNAAGFKFNQNYGFGMIDADALTQRVVLYSGVSPIQTETIPSTIVNATIPDNNPTGISRTFTATSHLPLESVTVTLGLTHPYRSDLEAWLTSPSGTVCRLFIYGPSGTPYQDLVPLPDPGWTNLSRWTFTTHAFWGEDPGFGTGQWTLMVRDLDAIGTGTWDSYSVTFRMGRPTLAGVVLDGPTGPDLANQSSTTTMSAHWTGFTEPTIPVTKFAWAIGTAPGAANIMAFTDVGLATSASTSPDGPTLNLIPSATYYVTVRATDDRGIDSFVSSDGVQITGISGAPEAPFLHALAQPASVVLQWDPSPTPAVTFYRLWWKPSSQPLWSAATLVDNIVGTTATVSSLLNGTSYDFILRAVTATGNESAGSLTNAVPAPLITYNGTSYPNIQAAINAANGAGGGTVKVLAGTYPGTLTLYSNVALIGASPMHTLLAPAVGTDAIIVSGTYLTNPASLVSNVGITGGRFGIDAGSADVIIRNVIVHHMSSHGVTSGVLSRVQVINCTLAHNTGDGIHALGVMIARNVIADGNTGFGINGPSGGTVTYSNAYGNSGGDYSTGLVGGANSSTPVLFINEPANDYREAPFAVSIDAGDPADAFALERASNGNRINAGAFGNTDWAGRSPAPVAPAKGHGGGGGGCGLTGLEGVLSLAILAALRRKFFRR